MSPTELRQLRLLLGWSQARLAQELGVHPHTISKWERGVPGYPIPLVVAKYLRLITE